MNQILMTEQPKNKEKKVKNKREKSGEIDIKSIIRFFAIIIMIFGICLSGNGAYALFQDIQQRNSASEPVVTTERKGNLINLIITNDVGIKSVKYWWNDSTETVVEGKNKNKVETTINIIPGNNKLTISVVDINNNTKQYVKNYIQEEQDTTEPVISISNEDPNIKITVTDDTALDYIVYKYGDNPEVKVYATDDNPNKIEAYIDDVEEAEVVLSVEAVDKAQNIASQDQKVKGTTKPKIEVTPDSSDPSYLIIKATDNDGLRMVVFYINEQEYKTNPNVALNTKEFEYRIQVPIGETKLRVIVYNLSEQITEYENDVIRY